MELKLDSTEVAVLKRVLDAYLPELRSEVYHTENRGMRQELKKDEDVIKEIMARLEGAASPA